jgi:diguanylate cyclase (GGDEF)-like protein
MSIRKTLRITLILCSIVPLLLVSILAYNLNSRRLISAKGDNLWQLAQTNSNGLNALVENQKTEITLLALQSQIYNLVLGNQKNFSNKTATNKDITQNGNNLLYTRSLLYPSCTDITLYNKDKYVVGSSNAEKLGTTYKDSITLSYISITRQTSLGVSGLILNKDKKDNDIFCIEIGCPIFLNGDSNESIIGYLISTISISHFEDFIKSIVIGETGYGLILDKTGQIIYHPDKFMIGTEIETEKLRKLVSNFYKGNIDRSNTFMLTTDGTDHLYGYSVIPELDWVLLIQQDIPEIIDLANVNLFIILGAIIIFTVIMILLSISITNKYTGPIIELKDTMTTAAAGDLNVLSNVKSNNEFGELSRCFNKMLHIIRSNYYELSSMHDELITNEEELRNNYNHIEYLAYHDTLTDLPNKLSFINLVNDTINGSISRDVIHAIYYIDLDDFKNINDTLGHEYGDELLVQAADRLLSLSQADDIVSKVGGDEYLIFIEAVKSQDNAVKFAAKVLTSFNAPFILKGELTYISISIGIALYPKNGTSTNTLIKNADIAMYKSKSTGKNKYTLFDQSMENELYRNTQVLDALRGAIRNKEIYIRYQPQVNILTGKIIGFEALMRIDNAKLGNISPVEFIPIAEESGLIVELGEWILHEACIFTKSLHDMGLSNYTIAVNISSIQMNRPNFIHMVDRILKDTKLTPECLELEITESTIVSSISDTIDLLKSLHELGVRISLDDFGTGYSSLNYLTNMPINTLKIDKSFIDNINSNCKDSYIAETIIQLAHKIDVDVIAEGVEYIEQLDTLKTKKCDIIQGYLFSKPLLPDELLTLLQST